MIETELRQLLADIVAMQKPEDSLDNYLLRGDSLDRATIARAQFAPEIASRVIADVRKYAAQLASRELVAYDPAYQPGPHQVLTDSASNSSLLERIMARIDDDDAIPDYPSDAHVVGMFHTVRTDEGAVTAARLRGQGIATRRVRGREALIDVEGIYQPISDEVIYYEPNFQALIVGDTVLTTTPSVIQQQFGSSSRAQTLALQTFDDVLAVLPIRGIETFREAATSEPAMMAKLASISRALTAHPELAEKMTIEGLSRFLSQRPDIPIEIVTEDGKPKFVFDNRPQHRWNILKLVADDFLESALSGLQYESGSKQPL